MIVVVLLLNTMNVYAKGQQIVHPYNKPAAEQSVISNNFDCCEKR